MPTRHQGAPPPQARPGTSWGPWPTSGPHFLVYKSFSPRKNREKTFGMVHRRLEAELGQEHFCSPVEQFNGDTSLREGEIKAIVITNAPLIMGGLISINIFTSTISSPNPSSSLVFNLCLKTSDWYMWVASSVDYIL